jgi:hypothetical protein
MKTLVNKKGTHWVRVPDKNPEDISGIKELLAKGWKFCPKEEWKKKERDAKKPTEEPKKKVTKKDLKKEQKNLKKLFGTVSNQCDAKYVENPKANTLRDKILGKKK